MREIVLDAGRLSERERAQEYLKESFGFPDYYGKNLDALHDMLGELGDVRIIFRNAVAFDEKYGYPKRVLNVMRDAAEENLGIVLEMGEEKK